MEENFIYFKYHSSFFFEFLIWRIVKSSVFNSSLPRRFSLIQVRAKVGKSSADNDLSIFRRNEASVDQLCHYVSQLYSNTNNEGVLVLTWIKHIGIFKNKKVVHLFSYNFTSFLYQTNQWISLFSFSLSPYLISQSLYCIFHNTLIFIRN